MIRRFQYVEPSLHDNRTPVTITVSEQYLRLTYWKHWSKQWRSKFNTEPCFETFIDDFLVVHWATEL